MVRFIDDHRAGLGVEAGGRRNPDPSRGGGRGRRAGGRGGRGDLPGSADAEPGRPAPSGAGRAPGTAACSKDSDRYKVAKCIQAEPAFCGFGRSAHSKVISVSVLSMAAITRRADDKQATATSAGLLAERDVHGVGARGAISDWTTRSNRGTTAPTGSLCRSSGRSRGSGGHTGPSPHVSARCLRYPNESLPASSGGCGRRHACGRKQPRPQEFAKPRRRGFAQRPQPSSSSSSRRRRTRQPARCTDTRPELISSK